MSLHELADIHSTLVSWHKHLEPIKSTPFLPDDVKRVMKLIEENNIGMLTLILHLMLRATMNENTVTLTR